MNLESTPSYHKVFLNQMESIIPFTKNVHADSNQTSKSSITKKIIPFHINPSYEELTIKKAKACILKNLSNPDYKVPTLARDTAYSQRQLTRIIKKMTGLSPVHFVLDIRLTKAYEMLACRSFPTIAQIREEVGILHSSYFTRKFIEKFGVRPKELMVG